jgi:hypothetical protein
VDKLGIRNQHCGGKKMFFVNVDKEPEYPHKIYVIHNKRRLIHIFSQGECVYIK